jgi:hypothetical protein
MEIKAKNRYVSPPSEAVTGRTLPWDLASFLPSPTELAFRLKVKELTVQALV